MVFLEHFHEATAHGAEAGNAKDDFFRHGSPCWVHMVEAGALAGFWACGNARYTLGAKHSPAALGFGIKALRHGARGQSPALKIFLIYSRIKGKL